MNLTKLFEMQRDLDNKIIEEKGLEDMDRLPYLILALQVELGECANEWRGFKYWSNDREPRTQVTEYKQYVGEHGPRMIMRNPLLEEYVDCLHFILSIGLHMEITFERMGVIYKCDNVLEQFLTIFDLTSLIQLNKNISFHYQKLVQTFLGLGEMLGFTWERIEQAYLDKNAVNHERQTNGY